jgi:hypothetical protein
MCLIQFIGSISLPRWGSAVTIAGGGAVILLIAGTASK